MDIIPFKIVQIKVEKFEIQDASDIKLDASFDMQTKCDFGINKDLKLISCRMHYIYRQNDNAVLHFVLICTFNIEEKAFDGFCKDNKFTLDTYFSQYLATINVGAARGEIHARCEAVKSPLANLILPPINLTKILNKPIEFSI